MTHYYLLIILMPVKMTIIQSLFLLLIVLVLYILMYWKETLLLSNVFPTQVNSSQEIIAGKRLSLQSLFKERLDNIVKVCEEEKENLGEVRRINDQIWSAEPHHGLVMCRTAKHGSTTWASYFVKIYTKGKSGGSQTRLKDLEVAKIPLTQKLKIINSLRSKDHKYASFFVCRNPLEKLQSLYNFFLYQTQVKKKIFKKFPRSNPPSWSEYISHVSNLSYSDSMSDSVFSKCSPCTYHYDAVVMMETFNQDSSKILTNSGLGWLSQSHKNNHGSHKVRSINFKVLFENNTKEEIGGIIRRYSLDFRLCGYQDTLDSLGELYMSKSD